MYAQTAVRTGRLGDRAASDPTGRPGNTAKKKLFASIVVSSSTCRKTLYYRSMSCS